MPKVTALDQKLLKAGAGSDPSWGPHTPAQGLTWEGGQLSVQSLGHFSLRQPGIRLLGFKGQQLLTLGSHALRTSPLTSLSLRCLINKMGATAVARTSEGMCEAKRGCSHTELRGLPDWLLPLPLLLCAVESGPGSNSQTFLQGKQRPQAVFCWGPCGSHLHSDHQDFHHLQHQLEGLPALGPKFVTGTHEEVLETAAEVFLFQRGWRGW